MENFKRKIKFKNKGIYISVIILLLFLSVTECQRLNRRRPYNPRQRVVVHRTTVQRGPARAGARDSSLGNRRFNTPRRQNANNVNRRLNRQRERLDYLRQQRERLENKIEVQNAVLQQEMSGGGGARINSVRGNRIRSRNNQIIQNGGHRNSANVNIVQRHNTNVPTSGNRNMNRRRNINLQNLQNTQVVGRNRGGQNARTHAGNSVRNSNRERHRFVRPRAQTSNRQGPQLTSGRRRSNNNYSPNLNQRNNRARASPQVQTSTHRLPLPHFKPLSPNLLRQLRVQHQAPSTPVVRNIHSAVRGTSSGRIAPRPVNPTSQSFPQQPVVLRNRHSNRQTIDVNTLASPVQTVRVNPTQSTFVRPQASGQANQNVHVLMPFPSVVPPQGTSGRPVQVVSRTVLPSGDPVLRVVPAAPPPVAPTVAGMVPVAVLPSQRTQNLGLSLGTGVLGGTVSGNAVPIQVAPLTNIVHRNMPINSWMNHLFMGGEQPDSPPDPPDPTSASPFPTSASETVTELVKLLTSTTQGGSAAGEEEEEEIEWEDMPPITTTTTTTPVPTAQATTVPAASVIKSIAQRIVSLLLQRNRTGVSNARTLSTVPANTHRTIVAVRPTSAASAGPTGTVNTHKGSVIVMQGNGGTNSNPVSIPMEALVNAVQASGTRDNSVQIPTVLTPSLPKAFSSNLAPRHTGTRNQKIQVTNTGTVPSELVSDPVASAPINAIPSGTIQSQGGAILNLNDVIMSDSSPKTGNTNNIDGIVLTPYMSSNDLGGLSVSKISDPIDKQGSFGTKRSPIGSGPTVVSNQGATGGTAPIDLLSQLKSLISIQGTSHPTESKAVVSGVAVAPNMPNGDVSGLSAGSPIADIGGLSVRRILSPSEPTGAHGASQTTDTGISVGSNLDTTSRTADMDLIAKIKSLIDSKGPQNAHKVDPVSISPYLSSNDLGGLTVEKIPSPSGEPGPQGTSGSSTDSGNSPASMQSATSDNPTTDLLAKLKILVDSQGNPTTASTKPPPIPTKSSSADICTPRSPNFRCKGKDLFLTMESIGAWCLGMCMKRGCIQTVCTCGCDLPPPKPSPSAKSMTDAQRRMLSIFGTPPWARTRQPGSTQEPPEEEEWEPEDGTTTKAPMSTVNPWWAARREFRGTSPSPMKDFRLNPIDQHSTQMKKLDQHLSEINEVAWASELKSRLSNLAANSGASVDPTAAAGLNDNAQSSPPTDFKAPPDWQGTEWHLPTPAPKKPPTTPEHGAGLSGPSAPGSSWPRPLRDKWGRSERFTGNGAAESPESGNGWNMWNMQMPSNPWGNAFGGGGFDNRLSRFRFNWGGAGGSGSGGEEQEANDK